MPATRTCPQCGAALPDQGWEGLCPKCLVRVSLQDGGSESGAKGEPLWRFGDYELLEEIARGGMGVVYKARQISLNRTVALKMILAGQLASAADVQRFRAEAESAARLQHPNIVAIHEIGRHEGQHYFSMDYVEGQNLAEFVGQKPLPPKQAAKYLKILAEAIHYAHQQGILHRDLKPSNILIDQSDQSRITDFGLAKQMKGDSELTVSGQVLGSPNFMPPEQAAGKRKEIGAAADVYALGAILYFMLSGRPPFVAESLTETLRQVATVEPPAPHLLNPSVRRDLETICLKCLAKEPQRRYASAKELADEIERFLEDKPIFARASNRIEKTWRWCRRNPVISVLAGASSVLLLALAIGSPIAAFRINQEKKQATEKLWESYLAQARANRFSGRAGRRFDSLDALKKAAEIRAAPELRNEAIACMALTDLRVTKHWKILESAQSLIAVSPAADHYVLLDDPKKQATLFRLEDQAELMRMPAEIQGRAVDFRFSADGRYFGLTSALPGDSLGTIHVWDTVGNTIVFQRSTNLEIRLMDFSRDSKRIAVVYGVRSATQPAPVEVYELPSGALLWSFADRDQPNGARFDPTGQRLAVFGRADTNVQIRAFGSQEVLYCLAHPRPIQYVAWDPSGELLAASCLDTHVYVWDAATGVLRNVLRGHQSEVSGLEFSHHGGLLVTASWDGTGRLWDPLAGDLPVTMLGGAFAFSQDDRHLIWVYPKGGYAELADGAECRVLHSDMEPGKGPRGCSFSPDGLWLASGHTDGGRIWETATGRQVARLPMGNTWSVYFHPDGHSLFTSGADGAIQWPFDCRREGQNCRLQLGPPHTLSARRCGRASMDREGRLLSLVQGDQIRIVDVTTGNDRIPPIESSAEYVAVSPDGKWCADGGLFPSHSVRIWNLQIGQMISELPETMATGAVSFSSDGKWLAVCSATECSFWAVGSWGRVHVVPHEGNAAQARAAFSPDGFMVAVPSVARGVLLLTPGSWKELASLEPPSPQYMSELSFSPDSSFLAAAAETKQIHLWDVRSIRQQLAAMKLDWDAPPLPPATNQFRGPIAVTILESTNASISLKAKAK